MVNWVIPKSELNNHFFLQSLREPFDYEKWRIYMNLETLDTLDVGLIWLHIGETGKHFCRLCFFFKFQWLKLDF